MSDEIIVYQTNWHTYGRSKWQNSVNLVSEREKANRSSSMQNV